MDDDDDDCVMVMSYCVMIMSEHSFLVNFELRDSCEHVAAATFAI